MGVIIFIVLVTLGISLYDFISSRDINRLAHEVSAEKNKRYGAYALRSSYNLVLSIIMGIMLLVFGAFFFAQRGFGWNVSLPEDKTEKSDTFLLTINAPPVEHIETLPPSYKLSGKEGQGAPSEARQAQPEPEPPVEDTPPKPDRITDHTEASADKPKNNNTEKPKKYSSIEEQIRAEERKYFEEAGGEKKREEIRKKAEERKRLEEEKRKNAPVKPSNQNDGGNNGSKGQPMVNFVLNGRTPHNNDYWHIRNPGYTCGQGVSGQVVVKIKVNANGDVIEAKATGNVAGINPCLIQQSEAYARKSRFNAVSTPTQEGTITYVFSP